MIEIDGKIYRNLEEQVRKNKEDIESIDTNVTSNTSAITNISNRLDNLDLTYATDEDIQNLQSQINNKVNQDELNSTNLRVNTLESTVTQLTPQVAKSLKTPMSAPASTELVAVDTSNGQAMISIGDGLTIENDTLKLSGGQQQQINIDNISITKNSDDQIQAVKLKDATIKVDSTITYDNFSGITKLSTQDYQTLVTTGQLIINGRVITFDNNMLYLTPDGGSVDNTNGLISEPFTGTTIADLRNFTTNKNIYSIQIRTGNTFEIPVTRGYLITDGTVAANTDTVNIYWQNSSHKFINTNTYAYTMHTTTGETITFDLVQNTIKYTRVFATNSGITFISGQTEFESNILSNNPTIIVEYFE